MKKILVFALVPLLCFGQKGNFSHGVDVAFPNDNFKASAGTGWGQSIRYEYYLSKKLSAMGTASYVSFASVSYSLGSLSPLFTMKLKMYPIQLGAKFYLFNDSKESRKGPYVSGEAGIHILTGTVTESGVDVSPPTESDFSYAIGAGYRIWIFDVAYRQQFVTSSITSAGNKTINYSNVRLAWVFRSKRRSK